MEKMWHLKTKFVPVIVGARDMFKKGTDKHISKIPSSLSRCKMQNIALSGTAYRFKRVLSM